MAAFNHHSVAAIIGLVFASVKHLPRRVVKRGIKTQLPFSSIDGFPSRCFSSFFHPAAHRKAYASRALTTTRDIFKPFPAACRLKRKRRANALAENLNELPAATHTHPHTYIHILR